MKPRLWILCAVTFFVCACAQQDSRSHDSETTPATYLVLQKLSSSVAFYSSSGDLLGTIPVGKNPHEMILSVDGERAYVTDYGALGVEEEAEGGTTVTIIDVREQDKAGVIDLGNFRRPHGIDVDPVTGNLLITTENPDQLLIIDPTRREILQSFATDGSSSHMVTLSPDRNTAYVSNIGTRDVSVVNLQTGRVDIVPVGERPEGSDITRDGRTLFVACRESNVISIVDTEQRAVIGEVKTSRGPNRVRLTPDENLLVYSLVHDSQIGFADVETGAEVAVVDLGGSPVSLQLSADGERALTAAQGSDSVYVVSVVERRIVDRFATENGAGPDPVLELTKAPAAGGQR